jgi:hypothetical protein
MCFFCAIHIDTSSKAHGPNSIAIKLGNVIDIANEISGITSNQVENCG